ncbi:MAG: BTAD domain-containing putative transcriptional regulator [Acidimicrobiales bacterium]
MSRTEDFVDRGTTAFRRAAGAGRGVDDQPSDLVARDRVRSHLDQILWGARRGTGGATALRGEPGVGKSALIEAMVTRAADFEVVQLRGTAVEEEGTLAVGWPPPLARLLGEAQGLPESIGAGGRPPTGLTAAAAAALREMVDAVTIPLLVTIDDAQALPPGFPAALLDAVVSELADLPIAVVVAFRDAPGLVVTAPPDVPEHRLGGLTMEQAATLLRRQNLRPPAPDVLANLVRATGGNPQALLETCQRLSLDELGGWRTLPDPVPIGERLAEAFGAPLAALPEPARRAIGVAASGGLSMRVLSSALRKLGLELDQLRTAQEAGIVTIRGERLDFLHPLVRAAAFYLLPTQFRADVRQAVSKSYWSDGDIERSAFHATQERGARDDTLARLRGLASQVALDRGEPESAARHEEVAAECAKSDDASARHLARAAALWMSAAQTSRALVCLERARSLRSADHVQAEISYQSARARLAAGSGTGAAEEMLAAAALCEREAPHRSVFMLADAAACRLLDGADDAGDIAQRSLVLARAVSSHAEALAQATLGASEGPDSSAAATGGLMASTSLLIGQTQRFTASPELAYVIGVSLLQERHGAQAIRWAGWLERCAEAVRDRSLAVVPPLLRAIVSLYQGRLDDAMAAAEQSYESAKSCEHQTLGSRALAVLTEACAALGAYERGFAAGATLLAMPLTAGRTPRTAAQVALAQLELQRDRPSSAFAWLRTAHDELGSDRSGHVDVVRAASAPAIAEILVMGRRREEAAALVAVVEEAHRRRAVPAAWPHWVRGLATDDPEEGAEHFDAALRLIRGAPLAEARIHLGWGVRALEWSSDDVARAHLRAAFERFVQLNAAGWQALVRRQAASLPEPLGADEAFTEEPVMPVPLTGGERPRLHAAVQPEATPPWEVDLLGVFAVRQRGEPVSLPLSLAAQGLKMVALREKVPVDELVEALWPEAEPGVGMRRLRNVLWRVRASCGELLQRDGNFIRLASGTVTDVDDFRLLGEQALDRDTPREKAAQLAREALNLYKGELLPGDRYADWAAGTRESLARLHVQLLDLLVDDAVQEGHPQEALGLLDRLIEADPYEERHYLQAAELQAGVGNRRRALSTLSRAERALADLGVSPSKSLLAVRQSLLGT